MAVPLGIIGMGRIGPNHRAPRRTRLWHAGDLPTAAAWIRRWKRGMPRPPRGRRKLLRMADHVAGAAVHRPGIAPTPLAQPNCADEAHRHADQHRPWRHRGWRGPGRRATCRPHYRSGVDAILFEAANPRSTPTCWPVPTWCSPRIASATAAPPEPWPCWRWTRLVTWWHGKAVTPLNAVGDHG